LGAGLAQRWAAAGFAVVLGARSRDRAETAAQEIAPGNGAPPVRGMDNPAAARAGDIVILTVPFASHDDIVDEIRGMLDGKIMVDATVPLVPPKVATVQLPPQGSVAQDAQRRLGDSVKVVSAFQNVAAHKLRTSEAIDCDVLVCGDDKDARTTVIGLVEALGLRGIDAGPIANSVVAEALTSILIGVNRRYKVDGAGIRITGSFGGSGSA
jgi:NADPH-dependent F420 reductase